LTVIVAVNEFVAVMGAGLAALALAALMMSVTPAAAGVQAVERDSKLVTVSCEWPGIPLDWWGIDGVQTTVTPSVMPITTAGKPSTSSDTQWRGSGVRTTAESYEFCDSLKGDCVRVRLETGITPAGVKLRAPGMPTGFKPASLLRKTR
jgi:hypothetical protein